MTSIAGSTRSTRKRKSAEFETTFKDTTKAASSKDTTEVTTSKNTTKVTTSRNATTSKNTSDTGVVRNLVDLTLNDKDNRGFNTEDYRDKNGEDFRYNTSQEIRSNFDDNDNTEDSFEDYSPQIRDKDKHSHNKDETYLTKKNFNYTMELVNEKINTMYKLCKFIANTQQDGKKSLQKLVVIDELSDGFWAVSYLTIFAILFNLQNTYNDYICSVLTEK